MITVRTDRCDGCGVCVAVCPACALTLGAYPVVDYKRCTVCMRCVKVCPVAALESAERRALPGVEPETTAIRQEQRCDVLVVGGGPAGALAAKYAALGGAAVMLVERRADVGVPIRCGEGIGKKGVSLTLDIKPEWIKSTIKKISMVAPDGRVVEVGNVDESYVVDRSIMDRALLQDAEKAGAQLFMRTSVTSITRCADARYHGMSPEMEFVAPCVILADGVEARLARDCGLGAALDLKDIETCAFGRFEGVSIPENTCIFYTGSAVAPGGYLWVFPRGQGSANIGLGLAGNRSSAGRAERLLRAFVKRHFPGAVLKEFHCGGVPIARWRKPLVRGGVMVVGDAGSQVNCINGGGIAYALLAGRCAGTVAAESFTNRKFNPARLKKYQKLWARFHGKQQRRSYVLKEMLLNYDDSILNNIAAALAKENPDKLNYFHVFMRTFSKHPLLMFKAFRLFR